MMMMTKWSLLVFFFPSPLVLIFGDCTKCTNNNWYHRHFYVPYLYQFSSKAIIIIIDIIIIIIEIIQILAKNISLMYQKHPNQRTNICIYTCVCVCVCAWLSLKFNVRRIFICKIECSIIKLRKHMARLMTSSFTWPIIWWNTTNIAIYTYIYHFVRFTKMYHFSIYIYVCVCVCVCEKIGRSMILENIPTDIFVWKWFYNILWSRV